MSKKNELYREAAISIAKQLCRDAIWHKGACNWLSTYRDPDDAMLFYTRSCNEYFYDGVGGIAFFLITVSSISDDVIIKDTAKGALRQLMNSEEASGIGFYTGLTGLAFVLCEAGDVLNEKKYRDAGKQRLRQIIGINPADCRLDVAEGIAGAIPFLIHLQKKNNDKQLKEFIFSIAEFLLQKKVEHAFGWSWCTMEDTIHDLTGFGHGASGIAHAFACMYEYTGENKFAEAVEKAFGYEDYYFNAAQKNWPDFRKRINVSNETICSLAWCHGAPGIGMARLYAGKVFDRQNYYDDVMKAVKTTCKHNSIEALGNVSLCHGLSGNMELLLQTSVLMKDHSLLEEAEAAADLIISSYISKKIPLPGGVGNGAETPGFMTGNAGVGYFLLRMYNPAKFPSVLLFS